MKTIANISNKSVTLEVVEGDGKKDPNKKWKGLKLTINGKVFYVFPRSYQWDSIDEVSEEVK